MSDILFARSRCARWEIQHIFLAQISWVGEKDPVSQRLTQNRHRRSPNLFQIPSMLLYFRTRGPQRINLGHISHFLIPPAKITGEMREILSPRKVNHRRSGWMFQIHDVLLTFDGALLGRLADQRVQVACQKAQKKYKGLRIYVGHWYAYRHNVHKYIKVYCRTGCGVTRCGKHVARRCHTKDLYTVELLLLIAVNAKLRPYGRIEMLLTLIRQQVMMLLARTTSVRHSVTTQHSQNNSSFVRITDKYMCMSSCN